MKSFQKKLALADVAVADTTDQHHCSGSYYFSSVLSNWFRNLDKLCRRIDTYFSARALPNWPPQETIQDEAEAPPFSFRTDATNALGWAPLVKAKSSRKLASIKQPKNNEQNAPTLAGQTVLCVGGRSRLYPMYSRLTEQMNGRLVTFHGDSNDQLKDLPRLLEKTDMIICPIDCVNHEAFFMVKFYCRFTGKPCVLLERSESTSFQNGIRALSKLF